MLEQEFLNRHIPTLRKLSFSREVFEVHGSVLIHINFGDVEQLYLTLSEEAGFADRHYNYIQKGLEKLEEASQKGLMRFNLNANQAHQLKEALEHYEYESPSWLPQAFMLEEPNGGHARTYLWDWSTIAPEYIPTHLNSWLKLKLEAQITNRSKAQQPTANRSNTQAQSTNTTLTTNDVPDAAPSNNGSANARATHGVLVAKKYLSLCNSASERGLEFDIGIEELSSLLQNRVCHFTKQPLVTYEHDRNKFGDSDELPKNYLTIDRVNNNLGYISGNVVACAKEVNQMKNQMTEEEFTTAMAMRTLLQSGKFSAEQLSILAS